MQLFVLKMQGIECFFLEKTITSSRSTVSSVNFKKKTWELFMAENLNCLGVASLYLLRGITHEKTVISSQKHETLFYWVFAQQPVTFCVRYY